MKKLLTVFLFPLAFTALYAQNDAAKKLPPTLDTLIKEEAPAAYQKEQIIKFFNDTVNAAQVEESVEDILEVINQELPSSDIRSYSFKDAFAEDSKTDPKGFFDSYNRALLAYSVLEALGKNKDIHIVDFDNKAFLTLKKETDEDAKDFQTVYLQPSDPQELFYPTQEELNKANVFYTQNDVKSLILTRAAQRKIKEGNGDEFAVKPPVASTLQQAETLLKQALNLNPRNATAINALKALTNVMPQNVYSENPSKADRKKFEIITDYDILLLALQTANFNNNYAAEKLDLFVCADMPYCRKKTQKTTANNFLKALQEDTVVKEHTAEIIFALYSLDKYKQVLHFGNEYAKLQDINADENIYNFYYQMAMANAISRNYKNFQKFRNLFNADYPQTDEGEIMKTRLNNVALAMDIVTGRKTAAQAANEYNNGLGSRVHYFMATGNISDNTVESSSVLKSWPGYNNFRKQFLDLID